MTSKTFGRIDPYCLKNHPCNAELYADVADDELLESLERHGQLVPIVVASDGLTVVSGHRRMQGARKLGLKTVDIVVDAELTDELDIAEAVIQHNKQREKTNEQKLREFKKLQELEAERAKRRQATSTGGASPQLRANLPKAENPDKASGSSGRSRDKAAAQVGMSPRSAVQGAQVVDEIDKAKASGDTKRAAELSETLNKSINGAHKKVRKPAKGKAAPSAASMVDELTRKHVGKLVRGIDAVAELNGGKGAYHEQANDALNQLIECLKKMREGGQ